MSDDVEKAADDLVAHFRKLMAEPVIVDGKEYIPLRSAARCFDVMYGLAVDGRDYSGGDPEWLNG